MRCEDNEFVISSKNPLIDNRENIVDMLLWCHFHITKQIIFNVIKRRQNLYATSFLYIFYIPSYKQRSKNILGPSHYGHRPVCYYTTNCRTWWREISLRWSEIKCSYIIKNNFTSSTWTFLKKLAIYERGSLFRILWIQPEKLSFQLANPTHV